MGDDPTRPAFSGATLTDYSTLDYNGYRVKNISGAYRWGYPLDRNMNHADRTELTFKGFKDITELSKLTGLETHGIELDYDIFENVTIPDPQAKGHVYQLKGYNFNLKKNAKAIDAGCVLPNITDQFSGKAPDLGALESGLEELHYGPRNK